MGCPAPAPRGVVEQGGGRRQDVKAGASTAGGMGARPPLRRPSLDTDAN